MTAAWGVIGVGYFSTFSFGNPTLFKEKKKILLVELRIGSGVLTQTRNQKRRENQGLHTLNRVVLHNPRHRIAMAAPNPTWGG